MSSHAYTPFEHGEETRVLTLEPGSYEDVIKCSLSNVSLQEPPSYEALSYVWYSSRTKEPPASDLEVQVAFYGADGGSTKTMMFGELQDSYLTERLYYSAGGLHRPGSIICDGVEVTVGGELHTALKHLRLEEGSRMLWVDALCINQSDFEERKQHIRSMGEIYARAKKVLVWLGDAMDIDSRAFEAFAGISEKLTEFFEEGEDISSGLRKALFLGDKKIRSLHWDALSELLRRAWFERVWVIQEVANAAEVEVIAGYQTYKWDHFAGVVHLLRHYDIDIFLLSLGETTAVAAIELMLSLKRSIEPGQDQGTCRPTLLEILMRSRHFKCTVAHDKIYAVLGLASDAAEDFVTVDYTLDASEIYTKFVVSHLTKRRALDVLYACAKSSGTSELDLPSWVPDWTQQCHHTPFLSLGLGSRACGDSSIRLRFEDTRSLFIWGKAVDSIAAVEQFRQIPREGSTPVYTEGQEILGSHHQAWADRNNEASRTWFRNAMDVAFPNKLCTPQMYEALWRTFVCNRTLDGTTPPPSWAKSFSDFMQGITAGKGKDALRDAWKNECRDPYDLREKFGHDDPYMKRIDMAMSTFNNCFGTWCFNRRFYRSVAGRFGWAPGNAQPGDEICIFYGGSVPFVLRPLANGRHEIVGDGYLYGVMDGEAMSGDFEEREFCIL